MAHLPIELDPERISLLLSSLFFSLILITLIIIKCMRNNTNSSVSLINASNATINKITIDPSSEEKLDFSHSSKHIHTDIIIDESTLSELDTPSMPQENKNASMMNLLLSHTRQSSFPNDFGNSQSVSTENILVPHVQKSHSPSPLTTPRDRSVKSLDSATVLENITSTQETRSVDRKQGGSVSRDNSPVPNYDEVS